MRKGGRHLNLAQVLQREPALADYWTFSFVRNPWSRMVSWWSMIDRNTQEANAGRDISRDRMERRKFWMGVAKYPNFETFVSKGAEEFLRLRRPQFDYLVTPTRRPDWIGRRELRVRRPHLAQAARPPRRYPAPTSQQEHARLVPRPLHPRLKSARGRSVQCRHRGVRLRVLTRSRAKVAQCRRDGEPYKPPFPFPAPPPGAKQVKQLAADEASDLREVVSKQRKQLREQMRRQTRKQEEALSGLADKLRRQQQRIDGLTERLSAEEQRTLRR